MTALYRLTGTDRSKAVAQAFKAALSSNVDGPATATVFLVGLGWNPTHNGTQEALIVRLPEARYVIEMIPYTRLISITGV